MTYETPTCLLCSISSDPIMASVDLKDLFAIDLWDMLVGSK